MRNLINIKTDAIYTEHGVLVCSVLDVCMRVCVCRAHWTCYCGAMSWSCWSV